MTYDALRIMNDVFLVVDDSFHIFRDNICYLGLLPNEREIRTNCLQSMHPVSGVSAPTFFRCLFAWHSYCDILIDDAWVKATPAFNLSLCEKFGLKPLEFDGETDSLFHEFDKSGNRHMEYLEDRGPFMDVPFEQILTTFKEIYNPSYIAGAGGDFHAEAARLE